MATENRKGPFLILMVWLFRLWLGLLLVKNARVNNNIGSDEPVTLNELAKTILESFFGKNIPENFLPKNVPDRPREVKCAYCSHRVAKELLDFKSKVGLKKGVGEMIRWAKRLRPATFYLFRQP